MQSRRSANSKARLFKILLFDRLPPNRLTCNRRLFEYKHTRRFPQSCFPSANFGNNKLSSSARGFCGGVWKAAITTTNSLFHPDLYLLLSGLSHTHIATTYGKLIYTESSIQQPEDFHAFHKPKSMIQIQSKDRGRRTERRI